jgi:hypothetical protein
MNVEKLAPYAKLVVAVGGVVIMLAKALVDGNFSTDEMMQVAIAAGVALGVYHIPNKTKE